MNQMSPPQHQHPYKRVHKFSFLNQDISLRVYFFLILFIIGFRLSNVSDNEISWDVLGYYLYLPATFIYDTPGLENIEWLKEINDRKNLTGTFYQVGSNQNGEPMYFFFPGMAISYLLFFILAHAMAIILGFPADGFSLPYQYGLVIGGLLYTAIGLYVLRSVLLRFFTRYITSIILVILVMGTNYIHHLTLDNLATVNVLFMLCVLVLLNTIKYHESGMQNPKYLFYTGVCCFFMAYVKPSEIFAILIPLFWGVTNWKSFSYNIRSFIFHWKAILLIFMVACIFCFPLMIYWYSKTGLWVYDPYKNPGVGLDFLNPHISSALFSFRKGWLVYTPIMLLALFGFKLLYTKQQMIFRSIFLYFIISFYIISSWTEWWYGAAYSLRPMITLYPALSLPLGYSILYILKLPGRWKMLVGSIIILLILLNQFQWYQFRHYIIDPYRMTKEYYKRSFLRLNVNEEAKHYLRVERDFTGQFNFKYRSSYLEKTIGFNDFEGNLTDRVLEDSSGNRFYNMNPELEFSPTFEFKFHQLSSKEYVWLEAEVKIRMDSLNLNQAPLLILSTEHKGGIYAYNSLSLHNTHSGPEWHTYKLLLLTPELRDKNDVVKCYIWNRNKVAFDIDDFIMRSYEPREFY